MKLGIVVPAAGSGTRFGDARGKLLMEIFGEPVLYWTLSALNTYPWAAACRFVIPTRKQDFQAITEICQQVMRHDWSLCLGGDTREASVRAAVSELGEWPTHVLIHDAARPVLASDFLDRLMAASDAPCVIPVVPCSDTLKEVVGGYVRRTISRDHVYRVQTPQLFSADVLHAVYGDYASSAVTDEAGLCERAGIPVRTVLGDSCNIKLTYPDEMPFVEMYLSRLP
jgi:2-C-methyl-D-erythritol 4-phosphate cytidylyltransferase